jgi:hypothetical protein
MRSQDVLRDVFLSTSSSTSKDVPSIAFILKV